MQQSPSKHWVMRRTITPEVEKELEESLSEFPRFFRKILYAREIENINQAQAYLEGKLEDGQDNPFLLKGMRETVDRLLFAIKKGEAIAVYGDYDVDGVTATALLTQVLQRMYGQPDQVIPYIPNRFDEGYGLNMEALGHLHDQGVTVVVTVDCGIRSPREAERAKELNIDLIISDHHHPGEELPDAFALICPWQSDDTYPYKYLSGVGLAYKIAQALERSCHNPVVCARDWLDLVAIGTVADVVQLTGENRILVRDGLESMRGSRLINRPGLCSLANLASVKVSQMTATDIAFMLGPRLNAAGRLNTALDALKLLMSDNLDEAGLLSQNLDNQNRERQVQTRKMQEEAAQEMAPGEAAHILFAFKNSFNPGVVGLVASRLVDQFYRPAVVGHIDEEFTRASCRSIPEFHITNALDECRDLMVRHGGHALAAGFTIRNENVPELQRRLREIAARELGQKDLQPVLQYDAEIPLGQFTRRMETQMFEYLRRLQPTGQGNPEAIFMSRDLQVVDIRRVGNDRQHLKLKVRAGSEIFDAIAFRQGEWAERKPARVDLLYVLEKNVYNGFENLQLNVRDLRLAEDTVDSVN